MRSRLLPLSALFLLVGCGEGSAPDPVPKDAGVEIPAVDGGGDGGDAGPEQLAQIGTGCSPTTGPAKLLVISGQAGCDTWQEDVSGLRIWVFSEGLTKLHPGGSIEISGNFPAEAQAIRWFLSDAGLTVLGVLEGTLFITEQNADEDVTGGYEVRYVDSTLEQGSFRATRCIGEPPLPGCP